MLQNARQILDIVRPTFPTLPFDDTERNFSCILPKSDGKMLSCLWSNVTSCVENHGCTRSTALQETQKVHC